MDELIRFVDIKQSRATHSRKEDLNTFEFSYKAEITSIHALTSMETLYRLRIIDPDLKKKFTFKPGQFVMLEIPGIGEAPFSISSSPSRRGDIELCIRTVGNLTGFLSRVPRGLVVGLRGPFGTHFPMEEMHMQNILLIAGGLGLAPLRSPIYYVQENRNFFRTVNIIYGTKHPSQLLFSYEYDNWEKDDISIDIIVEQPSPDWKGKSGLITSLLEGILLERDEESHKNTYAVVCGPPVMFKFVCSMLTKFDIPMQKMFVSLERRMHCGMGKCCRCNVGSTYTCLSGPVFDYWSVMNLKEAI